MSYARRLASIDEPALRFEHLRVRTRYHQGAINTPKHAIQRFGARHIPLDEFDTWQFRQRESLRPIAHQRTHRYAVARKFTYDRRAVQAGSAGYQDHAILQTWLLLLISLFISTQRNFLRRSSRSGHLRCSAAANGAMSGFSC